MSGFTPISSCGLSSSSRSCCITRTQFQLQVNTASSCLLLCHGACLQGPRCPLATRILFHCAHSRGDDDALMVQHSSLTNWLEDQLSLAALHFHRGHYQVGGVLAWMPAPACSNTACFTLATANRIALQKGVQLWLCCSALLQQMPACSCRMLQSQRSGLNPNTSIQPEVLCQTGWPCPWVQPAYVK